MDQEKTRDDQTEKEAVAPADRLCSEIQLFDLCDLESCRYKRDRFCTNEELLAKFEAIREEEDASLVYADDEDEEGDDLEFDEYDDEYEGEEE
jgi:hypothetical protein